MVTLNCANYDKANVYIHTTCRIKLNPEKMLPLTCSAENKDASS